MPPKSEIAGHLQSTAVMDWPAWGPTIELACEEFASALARAWPDLREVASTLLDQVRSEQLEAADGFGLLQDLVPRE